MVIKHAIKEQSTSNKTSVQLRWRQSSVNELINNAVLKRDAVKAGRQVKNRCVLQEILQVQHVDWKLFIHCSSIQKLDFWDFNEHNSLTILFAWL